MHAVCVLARNFPKGTVPFGPAHDCPLANTTEAKCALWKAVEVVIFQSSA